MSLVVVGLGPAGLDLIDERTRTVLTDTHRHVIVRTAEHPAATELADRRNDVTSCDDLYRDHDDFAVIYGLIEERVISSSVTRPTVYAVPGSPSVGERAVSSLVDRARVEGLDVTVMPGLSFLDLVYTAAGVDPISDGLQVLDGRDLPDPLPLHVPTVLTQVDSRLRAGDVAGTLGRTLEDTARVLVLDRLGAPDELIEWMTVSALASYEAGPRTSVFVPASEVGLLGLVSTNRTLRAACPWDREQTHHSLLTHLIEEAYEAADAIGSLPPESPAGDVDFGAYAEVEDELGDLLLQVVFHATLASEAGAFDIDEVAEMNRRKLVRRHPHVFGDVEVDGADDVRSNWEEIKRGEKQRASLMDDIPTGLPAIVRAMKIQRRASSVGFDWPSAQPVIGVLRSEVDELEEAAGDPAATTAELGDVLFAAVNLARHLDIDPEIALRGSVDRFDARFRHVETLFGARGERISEASMEELDDAWRSAKDAT